jgi:hypothetical protein
MLILPAEPRNRYFGAGDKQGCLSYRGTEFTSSENE